jgi:5-(carboxyamino)imidazole ribonucleotide synthase
MFTLEAKRMGYFVHTLSPDEDSPTGQLADLEYIASYDDIDAARDFASQVDVVTFEFENISADVVRAIEDIVPVHPSSEVLYIAQNRLREKNYLSEKGFPTASYYHIRSEDDLRTAFDTIGTPSVLKTAGFGYDGKGQAKINSFDDLHLAYRALRSKEAILEQFVSFDREISVVAARDQKGNYEHYGCVWNIHTNHILDTTYAPAPLDQKLAEEAIELSRSLMTSLGCIGILCVEMFITNAHTLLVNELAPRPHNSGHWTIDGSITNQFEQHVRAVCGLPLGSNERIRPTAMINVLGDLWDGGEPDWEEILKNPTVKLHLYGKHQARKGRKMGHINVTGTTSEEVSASVHEIKRILHRQ